MKFVLLIYHGSAPLPGSDNWRELSDEEQKRIYKECREFNNTPNMVSGPPLGLPSAANTVRVLNGKTVVQKGTHFEEGVDGYCVHEADNLEDAIKLAARIPAARLGGAIEIRPAEQYW